MGQETITTPGMQLPMVDARGVEIPYVDRDGKELKTVSERYYPAEGAEVFPQGRCH